jgi:D-alanyl-lipoteichoic acid acyltransferase DltB (MBOAT superfamily)
MSFLNVDNLVIYMILNVSECRIYFISFLFMCSFLFVCVQCLDKNVKGKHDTFRVIEVAGFEDIHDTFSTFMYVYSMIIVVYIKPAFL